MSKIIEKKTYSDYFEMILNGSKTYDLRLADFDCQPDDILKFVEIDKNRKFTGRTISKRVGWVGKTKEIDYFTPEDIEKYGYQVISLLDKVDVRSK